MLEPQQHVPVSPPPSFRHDAIAMGAPKGSQNARDHQNSLMAAPLELMNQQINKLERSQMRFANISELAKYLSPHVNVSSGRLLRNKSYRVLIENTFYRQNGLKTQTIRETSDLEISHGVIANQNLEIHQLKNDVKRLRKFTVHNPNRVAPQDKQFEDRSESIDNLCRCLSILLDSVSTLGFALSDEGIVNTAARPGSRLIVPKNLLSDIQAWCAKGVDG